MNFRISEFLNFWKSSGEGFEFLEIQKFKNFRIDLRVIWRPLGSFRGLRGYNYRILSAWGCSAKHMLQTKRHVLPIAVLIRSAHHLDAFSWSFHGIWYYHCRILKCVRLQWEAHVADQATCASHCNFNKVLCTICSPSRGHSMAFGAASVEL